MFSEKGIAKNVEGRILSLRFGMLRKTTENLLPGVLTTPYRRSVDQFS
jgi:hypothetical protein